MELFIEVLAALTVYRVITPPLDAVAMRLWKQPGCCWVGPASISSVKPRNHAEDKEKPAAE